MTTDPFDVDIVVVGAGFAGLTVASILQRRGVSVVVLEARDRVGGKVEAVVDDGGRLVDTGAQFVNDEMSEVLALAADVGASRANSLHPGRATTVPQQSADHPWNDAEALLSMLGDDHLGDDRTITQWLAGLADDGVDVSAATREAVRSVVNGVTCHDSNLIPVSYLAELNRTTPTHVHELQSWFPATLHSLAIHLAAPLTAVLRLDCPVRAIHLHDASVDVVALDQVWHAREVVIATPPSVYGTLGFTPALPDDMTQAALSFTPGTVIKYLLRYPRAFWLDHGLNGTAQFIGPPGLYLTDASAADAATLVGFVGGTTAIEWIRHSHGQRHDAIVHHASVAFGDAALRPTGVVERMWAPDEWGGGGYSNVQIVHAPQATSTLVAGLPLVTFASTELAARFQGYVEGAIVAGRAAASRVLQRLGRT
ncbi:MAG TPA: FAD-dependent oxidoreductase [Ilumatobacteraceae bacterium]|nr:FAD-dependent oxidoreductase [Ilumatobacteraceae bacterium]